MTVHNRQLDQLRLGELDAEEASELLRQLEEAGEMRRLDDLIVDADAFLEHYPAGPAVQEIRAKLRRIQRRPEETKAEPGFRPGILVSVGVVLSGMLVVFLVMPMQPAMSPSQATLADTGDSFIRWQESDLDCVGTEGCRAAALAAYEVGKQLSAQPIDDPAGPYEAYKQFERAQLLLARGDVGSPPDSMKDLLTRQAALKAELDTTFREASLNFRNFRTRKMYREMARELEELSLRFPDPRSQYNQWVTDQRRKMKDDGVYPVGD